MNDLSERISGLSVTAVSAIIFVGVILLAPLLTSAAPSQQLTAVLATALTSFGLYKLFAGCIRWVFGHFQSVRKLLLGRYFLEGTWVGHWIHEGSHVFTVEVISQKKGAVKVVGMQFGEDGKTQADWSSEIAIADRQKERLVYVYDCDVYRTKHQQNGIGIFRLVRSSNRAAPNVLDGYAVDMVDADKDCNTEYKISDDEISTETALTEARKKFGV